MQLKKVKNKTATEKQIDRQTDVQTKRQKRIKSYKNYRRVEESDAETEVSYIFQPNGTGLKLKRGYCGIK